MIELIWNLWQVQLDRLVEADLSQSPRYWHRIEHAVYGYVEMVRNQESGKRELRAGPRDRQQQERAKQMIEQVESLRQSATNNQLRVTLRSCTLANSCQPCVDLQRL
jgi:hypothetical protein